MSRLFEACRKGDVSAVTKILTADPASVHSTDEFSNNALLIAVGTGNLTLIDLLLDYGADVNGKAAGGITPLMCAAAEGQAAIVRALLQRAPNTELRNNAGKTALQCARKPDIKALLTEAESSSNSEKKRLRDASAQRVRDTETRRLALIASQRDNDERSRIEKEAELKHRRELEEAEAIASAASLLVQQTSQRKVDDMVAFQMASVFHSANAMLSTESNFAGTVTGTIRESSYAPPPIPPTQGQSPMRPPVFVDAPLDLLDSTVEVNLPGHIDVVNAPVERALVLDGSYCMLDVISGNELIACKVKLIHHSYGGFIEHEYKCLNSLFVRAPGYFVRPFALVKPGRIAVKGQDASPFRNYIGLVMEKGIRTLDDHFHQNPNMSYAEKVFILSRIVDVIEQAHLNRIAIMDLKGSNFMKFRSGDDLVWKAIDLDGALVFGQQLSTSSFKCTAGFMAPEIASHLVNLIVTPAIDVWSIGMLTYQLFSRAVDSTYWNAQGLYDDASVLHALTSLNQESVYRAIAKDFPGEQLSQVRHFLMHVLQVNPADRPSTTAIKTFPLLMGGASVSASMIFTQLTSMDRKLDSISASINAFRVSLNNYSSDVTSSISRLSRLLVLGNSEMRDQISQLKEGNEAAMQKLFDLEKKSSSEKEISAVLSNLIAMVNSCLVSCRENIYAQTIESKENKKMYEALGLMLQLQETKMEDQRRGIERTVLNIAASQTESVSELLSQMSSDLGSQMRCINEEVSRILSTTDKLIDAQLSVHSAIRYMQVDIRNNPVAMQEKGNALTGLKNFLYSEVEDIEKQLTDDADLPPSEKRALYDRLTRCIESAASMCSQHDMRIVGTAFSDWHLTAVESTSSSNTSDDVRCMLMSIKQMQENVSELVAEMKELKGDIRGLKLAVGSQMEMLTTILCGQYNVPAFPFIVPYKPSTLSGKLNPMRLFQDEMRLFFICPITMKPVASGIRKPGSGSPANGYRIVSPKAWVIKIAPVLVVCLAVLKTAMAVYGIPLPIPPSNLFSKNGFIDDLQSALVTSVLTDSTAADSYKSALRRTLNNIDVPKSDGTTEALARAGNEIAKATSVAYTELHRLLAKLEGEASPVSADWRPKHTGLNFKISRATGEGAAGCAWVSSEAEEEFMIKGRLAFSSVAASAHSLSSVSR